MSWEGNVDRLETEGKISKLYIRKRPLGRPNRRWKELLEWVIKKLASL